MPWQGTGAAVINGIGSIISGFMSQHSSASAAKRSVKLSKNLQEWQAMELPTLQKKGLIDAGYNPILAYGGQSMPNAQIAAQGAKFDNPLAAFADLPFKDSEKDLKKAAVEKTKAEVENLENSNELLQANTAKAEAESRTAEAQTIRHLAEARNVEQNIKSNAPNARKAEVLDKFMQRPEVQDVIRRNYLIDSSPKTFDDMIMRSILNGDYDRILRSDPSSHSAKEVKEFKEKIKRDIEFFEKDSNFNKTKKYSSSWLPTGR